MAEAPPRARVGSGLAAGTWHDGVAVFRGIPYAAPPVAARRFAAAVPPEDWTGERAAVADGPVPPQPPSRLRAATGDFTRPQNEDCLTLTIWTPVPDGKRRPVLVWLHGGAFMTGAGSLDGTDGSVLAREGDLVVVGVNYRLGACGFLSRPGVSPGNLGLGDQEAALAWIAQHIAGFGGDPAQVTLMGQSAGGGSILFLLTQPSARRLFHRAILQSPSLGPPLPAKEAATRANRLLALLDIDGTKPDAADRARAVPIKQLLAAQMELVRQIAQENPLSLPFGPVGEQAMTRRDYLELVADGAKDKDILLSWTREEMHAFFAADPAMLALDEAALGERALALTGDPKALERYRRRRPDGSALDAYADLVSDQRFIRPAKELAGLIAERGGKIWTFQFDWAPPGSKFKACHCIPIPFVFGTLRGEVPMLAGGDPQEMEKLSLATRRSTIAFVRTGDPQAAALPSWSAWQSERPATLAFDRGLHLL